MLGGYHGDWTLAATMGGYCCHDDFNEAL